MKLSSPITISIAVVLAIIVVFIIDPLDPSTFSTPFCLGMILMWLSLRQKAWVVLLITFCYAILDCYASVWFMGKFQHPAPHPYFWFFQRFGLFLVVCVMAIYLSYHREQSEKNLERIQAILGKLPAPVVVSDGAGYVVYANEALCSFFNQKGNSLVGKRYLDLFMTNIDEGKAMRYYIELFAAQEQDSPEVDLMTSVNNSSIKASLTCLGTGSNRNMITVLQQSAAR